VILNEQMIYALVHFPEIDLELINGLRADYDPQFNLIAPHITIVFPVLDSIGEHRLVSHMQTVLRDCLPFPIRLKGLMKSWDEYLFLTVQKGEDDVIRLHDNLYTGLLSEYRNKENKFVPHLTLGKFTGQSERYEQARAKAEESNPDYECLLDKLHLVKVNDERSQVVRSKEFRL
jgi:2'-5' RNA ligase